MTAIATEMLRPPSGPTPRRSRSSRSSTMARQCPRGRASRDHVVKATVFVTDLGDFAKPDAIDAKRFGAHKPTHSTVQVAALPRGASVEIELVARLRPIARPDPNFSADAPRYPQVCGVAG